VDNNRLSNSFLFPFLGILSIAIFGGVLGGIFLFINEKIIEEWGVVILGTAIVVIVPTLAALAERKWGQKTTIPVTDPESNAND